MNGNYLLDTNIVIAIFNNDTAINKKLVTVDELFYFDIPCSVFDIHYSSF